MKLIFIPIMTPLEKLTSVAIPPDTRVTFPHALNAASSIATVNQFNTIINKYFFNEIANTTVAEDILENITRLSSFISHYKPGVSAMPETLANLLCCENKWYCMNKFLCECVGDPFTPATFLC